MYPFDKGRYVAYLITLCCFCVTVKAQPKFYTLNALIDSATRHLPFLFEKQSLVSSYKAMVTDARHSFLPRVKINDQVNIGSNNSLAGAYLPMGTNISVSAGVRGENDYGAVTGNLAVLYGEYELTNFGLKTAKVNYAVANVNAEEADQQRILYEMKEEIGRLYFKLLKAEY